MMKRLVFVIVMGMLLAVSGLAPLPPVAQAQDGDTCPGFLPSRLAVGGTARVLPEVAPGLFAAPELGAAYLLSLPAGAEVAVLDGPACILGSAWWQIDYEGTVGWVAEGVADQYWFEPLTGPVQVPAADLPATFTAADGSITFNHPEDYTLIAEQDTVVILANREALDPSALQLGERVLAVFKQAQYVDSLINATGTPMELLEIDAAAGAEQGIEYGELFAVTYGEREAAYALTSTGVVMIVDLGDGTSTMLVILANPDDDLVELEALALAIGQTLIVPSSVIPLAGLEQSFTSPDGRISFNLPGEWVAEPLDNLVLVVSDVAVYGVAELDDLQPGQLLVLIYPTVADIADYPAPIDDTTVPSTIVSFFASMGMVTGYTQDQPMEVFDLGGRPASSSLQYGANHDRLVVSVANGDDITTLVAFSSLKDMGDYQEIVLAIAASMGP